MTKTEAMFQQVEDVETAIAILSKVARRYYNEGDLLTFSQICEVGLYIRRTDKEAKP